MPCPCTPHPAAANHLRSLSPSQGHQRTEGSATGLARLGGLSRDTELVTTELASEPGLVPANTQEAEAPKGPYLGPEKDTHRDEKEGWIEGGPHWGQADAIESSFIRAFEGPLGPRSCGVRRRQRDCSRGR